MGSSQAQCRLDEAPSLRLRGRLNREDAVEEQKRPLSTLNHSTRCRRHRPIFPLGQSNHTERVHFKLGANLLRYSAIVWEPRSADGMWLQDSVV